MERGRRGGTAVEGWNGGGGAGDLVGWWGRTVEGRRMEGGFFFFCYFFRGVFGKCLEDGEKPEHSTENQWKMSGSSSFSYPLLPPRAASVVRTKPPPSSSPPHPSPTIRAVSRNSASGSETAEGERRLGRVGSVRMGKECGAQTAWGEPSICLSFFLLFSVKL